MKSFKVLWPVAIATGIALASGCGPLQDDELQPSTVNSRTVGSDAEYGVSTSAICEEDGIYRYDGKVSGYDTWSKKCSGKGYQTRCSGSRKSKRDVSVAWSLDGYYYLTSTGTWRTQTGGCDGTVGP